MDFPNSHPPMWSGYPGNHQDHSNQVPPKRARYPETSYGQYMPMNLRMIPPANPIGSKRTTHIFFKTRMCAKFLEGSCRNGANCTFAHGNDDLRKPPPNWQGLVRDGGPKNGNDDQRMIHKMKICRKFYNGEVCPYGQSCNFLHERPNQNSVSLVDQWSKSNSANPYKMEGANPFQRDNGAYNRPTITKVMNPISDASVIQPSYWKSKQCSEWEITGQCRFGETCHFAHGHSKLHVPSVPVEADLSTIQIKPSTLPVIDPTLGTDIGAQIKVVSEDKKLSRWKPKKKINKIYGDWLDDLAPHHASPKKVES